MVQIVCTKFIKAFVNLIWKTVYMINKSIFIRSRIKRKSTLMYINKLNNINIMRNKINYYIIQLTTTSDLYPPPPPRVVSTHLRVCLLRRKWNRKDQCAQELETFPCMTQSSSLVKYWQSWKYFQGIPRWFIAELSLDEVVALGQYYILPNPWNNFSHFSHCVIWEVLEE